MLPLFVTRNDTLPPGTVVRSARKARPPPNMPPREPIMARPMLLTETLTTGVARLGVGHGEPDPDPNRASAVPALPWPRTPHHATVAETEPTSNTNAPTTVAISHPRWADIAVTSRSGPTAVPPAALGRSPRRRHTSRSCRTPSLEPSLRYGSTLAPRHEDPVQEL